LSAARSMPSRRSSLTRGSQQSHGLLSTSPHPVPVRNGLRRLLVRFWCMRHDRALLIRTPGGAWQRQRPPALRRAVPSGALARSTAPSAAGPGCASSASYPPSPTSRTRAPLPAACGPTAGERVAHPGSPEVQHLQRHPGAPSMGMPSGGVCGISRSSPSEPRSLVPLSGLQAERGQGVRAFGSRPRCAVITRIPYEVRGPDVPATC
jgi:hypothetical protein